MMANESTYTPEELAKAAELLDSNYDIVATALRIDGKDRYTLSDAKKIVQKFSNTRIN